MSFPAGTDAATHAVLDVALLPWRPRLRRINPNEIRDLTLWSTPDDLAGLVFSLLVTVVVFVAAPLIAVVLAVLFLPVEIWIAAALGVLFIAARFTGLIPWTVIMDDGRVERHRFLPGALARVRELNGGARPRVRWHWA